MQVQQSSRNVFANNLGDGRWQLGATEAEAKKATPQDEAAVNAVLAQYRGDLVAFQGELRLKGGTPIRVNQAALTSDASSPHLPDVSGPKLGPQDLGDRVGYVSSTPGMTDAGLMWSALLTLVRTADKDRRDSKQFKNGLDSALVGLRHQQLATKATKIKEEQKAAFQRFMWQLTGAVVQMACAVPGLTGSQAGGAWGQVGTAGNTIFAGFGEMYLKTEGAQSKADKAELESDGIQIAIDMMQARIKNQEADYEDNKKMSENGLRTINEYIERRGQIIQAAHRG